MKQVQVDNEACGDPLECRRCLDRCPEKVFAVYPRQKRTPERHAAGWAVVPAFAWLCTDCGDCQRFCPRGAIRVQ